jgi:hypothetical protein
MQDQEDKFVESRGIVGGFKGRNLLRKREEVNITQVATVLSEFA